MVIHVRDGFMRAAVSVLSRTMTELIDTCFPLKTVTRHSSDNQWVTDRFRHLIRQRRMSGDHAKARRLRNLVNRAAPQLRQQFYQSKIDSMEESSTRDWWKHMKILMGTSCEGNSEMQGALFAKVCYHGATKVVKNSYSYSIAQETTLDR